MCVCVSVCEAGLYKISTWCNLNRDAHFSSPMPLLIMNDGCSIVSLTHNRNFRRNIVQTDTHTQPNCHRTKPPLVLRTNRKKKKSCAQQLLENPNFLFDVTSRTRAFPFIFEQCNSIQFYAVGRNSTSSFRFLFSVFFLRISRDSRWWAIQFCCFWTTMWSKLMSNFRSFCFASLVNLLIKLNRRVGRHNIYSAFHLWLNESVGDGCRFALHATENHSSSFWLYIVVVSFWGYTWPSHAYNFWLCIHNKLVKNGN